MADIPLFIVKQRQEGKSWAEIAMDLNTTPDALSNGVVYSENKVIRIYDKYISDLVDPEESAKMLRIITDDMEWLKRQAIHAWNKSLMPKSTRTQAGYFDDRKGELIDPLVTETITTQNGDPRYLNILLNISKLQVDVFNVKALEEKANELEELLMSGEGFELNTEPIGNIPLPLRDDNSQDDGL